MLMDIYDVCNDYSEEFSTQVEYYNQIELRRFLQHTYGCVHFATQSPRGRFILRCYNEDKELIVSVYEHEQSLKGIASTTNNNSKAYPND